MRISVCLLLLGLAACGSDEIGEVTVDARGLEQVWVMQDDAWTQLEVDADGRARFVPAGPYGIAGMCAEGASFGRRTTVVRLAGAGDPTSWSLPCYAASETVQVTNDSALAVEVFLPHGHLAEPIAAGDTDDARVPSTTGDVVAVGSGVQIVRGVELRDGEEIVVDPMSAGVPLVFYELDVVGTDVQFYGALITRDHTEAFFEGAAGVSPSDLEAGDQQYLVTRSFGDDGEKFARVDVGPGTGELGRLELDLSIPVPSITVDATDGFVVTWSPDDPWPHQRVVMNQPPPGSLDIDLEAFPGWTSVEPDREHRLTLPALPDWGDWTFDAAAGVYHWDVTLTEQISSRVERGVFSRNW